MRHESSVASGGGTREHPRTIGWIGTTALAMGGSNQSLFLIGALVLAQGTSAIPLLAVGLLLGWMALPGWTELIMMWPNRVGGISAACAEAHRNGVARKPRANASTRPRRTKFGDMADLLWRGAKCLHGNPLPDKAGQLGTASDVGQCPTKPSRTVATNPARESPLEVVIHAPQRPLRSGAKHVQIADNNRAIREPAFWGE